MKTNLFDQNGKVVWDLELNSSIFGLEPNDDLVHRALMYQLANARTNVAHTKTRWERRGSTRKIYRQKWTGRARAWSNRSPIRKKGWIVFGPRNTINFELSMNKKERRKALFIVLSSKLSNKELLLVDKIELDSIKTKKMDEVLKALPIEKNVLMAISEKNEVIEKSSSNLPQLKTILVNYLNIKDLLKYKTLILMKDSLSFLENQAK